MTIEQKVTSLELARKLDKAGWEYGRTVFVWCRMDGLAGADWHIRCRFNKDFNAAIYDDVVDAPLPCELGEVLPKGYHTVKAPSGNYQCFKIYDTRCCPIAYDLIKEINSTKTEADARAKMYLYLKKEGLIK